MYRSLVTWASIAVLSLFSCTDRGVQDDHFTIKGEAQGTTFSIKYIDTLQRDLSGEVDSLLKVIDGSLSLWVDGSTVSRFNEADTFMSDDVHFRTMVSLSEEL